MLVRSALLAFLSVVALAQADSTTTTITAYGIPAATGVAASVVSANACGTTLIASCTDAGAGLCAKLGSLAYTIIQEPTAYQVMFSGMVAAGASGAGSNSCRLATTSSTTTAVCVISASAAASGSASSTFTTATITGTNLAHPVAVTAGANLLAAATGSCTASSTSSSSGGAAAPTRVSEVYKVLVPVGAALLGVALV